MAVTPRERAVWAQAIEAAWNLKDKQAADELTNGELPPDERAVAAWREHVFGPRRPAQGAVMKLPKELFIQKFVDDNGKFYIVSTSTEDALGVDLGLVRSKRAPREP